MFEFGYCHGRSGGWILWVELVSWDLCQCSCPGSGFGFVGASSVIVGRLPMWCLEIPLIDRSA